ncbi:MAG: Uma2 family endonuclease [Rhodospirillales bacterium]
MNVSAFLAWDSGDRSGRPWQLVDGVPQAMAPASRPHGAILAELARLIGNHLLAHAPHCSTVIEAGVVPRVRATTNVRIPDLAVTCSPSVPERLLTDPILLVEILSPSNADETIANVWAYTTIPSVREILIVASTERRGELLRRLPDGSWPESPEAIGAEGSLTLESVGMELKLAEIYRTAADDLRRATTGLPPRSANAGGGTPSGVQGAEPLAFFFLN